ncbi:MAG: hypothetical protein ABI625_04685 [bacterium]
MALRTFKDSNGQEWNAWHVWPEGAGIGVSERYRDGWVCFERVGGGDRCRIPIGDVPAGWENLPDDRLGLLRRISERSPNLKSSDGGVSRDHPHRA